MNTTLLFAEILIVGLQSGVWIIFLILTIMGANRVQDLSSMLREWQPVLLAVIIPILYVIGIIIDRFADRIFEKWNARTKKQAMGDEKLSLTILRFSLGKDNDFLNQQIEYTRTRMRIARASAINFLLIAIFVSTFIIFQTPNITSHQKWIYATCSICTGIFLSISAIFTWRSLFIGYIGLIRSSYRHFIKDIPANKRKSGSSLKPTKEVNG